MNQENESKELLASPLPLLSRLDRLDRLLQYLEERHDLSAKKHSVSANRKILEAEEEEEEDQCKTLSSALEEVHYKGNLMERMAMLENRMLQVFSLVMDVQNASRSSPSTVGPLDNFTGDETVSSFRTNINGGKDDATMKITHQHKEESLINREGNYGEVTKDEPKGKGRKKKVSSKIRYKKWLGRFTLGC